MFLNQNIIVSELWAGKKEYKKTKPRNVSARGFYSLSFRLSGFVKFGFGEQNFTSSGGHITFMPADVSYLTEVCQEGEMLLVHFKTVRSVNNSRPFSIDMSDSKIQDLFLQLVSEFKMGKEHDYRCMSLLYAILATIEDYFQYPQKKLIPRRMRLAKSFIDKNYNEQIFVHVLAKEAGISEVHFRNEFKRCFGTSPLEYIKAVRINNAKQLLVSGYHSVSEVATMCGFDSISYFSYEFKRLTGKTPKEYMNGKNFS